MLRKYAANIICLGCCVVGLYAAVTRGDATLAVWVVGSAIWVISEAVARKGRD